MGAIQPWHIIVLAVVVVALFGYNKLPDVTRSVGRSLRIFKTEMKGLSEDDKIREEAKEHGTTAVAPSVAPVVQSAPVVTGEPVPGSVTNADGAVPPVAAATAAHTDPTAEQIAHAQAVLAAAERSRTASADPTSSPAPTSDPTADTTANVTAPNAVDAGSSVNSAR